MKKAIGQLQNAYMQQQVNISSENKRIAKNTIMLYIRMFLVIVVTFFSFRLLLGELGDIGYGIYNVVGGIVILFSFLNTAMMQSSQRYMSYYLGRNDAEMLNKVFSVSINVHLIIGIVAFFLCETIGLWFLNSYMKFPFGSIHAVNIVYQCSIISFLCQIMTVPFQAMIISYEKMSFFAYFSIIEVMLKLSAVLILYLFDDNKLIIYSIAIVIIYCSVLLVYFIYCKKQFVACAYTSQRDSKIFKDLFSFSGWNMLGGIGNVGASQGVNIIFNIFYGVLLNAAMGVANQVGGAVSSFVSNLQIAFNPQIIKSYSSSDSNRFISLIFKSSRYSFLLIFVIGFPVILYADIILHLWLTDVPKYAVQFTQLIICFCMIDAMSGSLWTAAQACGKIRNYMIIISLLIFSNVPIAYLLLSMKYSPICVIQYKVVANIVIHIFRIIYLHKLIDFPSLLYCRKVMLPIIYTILICIPVPIFLKSLHNGLSWDILVFIFCIIQCGIFGLFILMTKVERNFLIEKLKLKIIKSIK